MFLLTGEDSKGSNLCYLTAAAVFSKCEERSHNSISKDTDSWTNRIFFRGPQMKDRGLLHSVEQQLLFLIKVFYKAGHKTIV